MAAPSLIAVFDIGKTNLKLTAYGREGAEIVRLDAPNAPLAGGDYLALDTQTAWAFLLDGLARIARHGQIARIITTTHACAAALVDADGLVAPVMDYEWDGLETATPDYDAMRAPFEETGTPRLPLGLNLGRQLYYFETRRQNAFARTAAVLPYPQYWAWRLCGARTEGASDVSSLGCHSDLWAVREGRFSSLARQRGWDRLFAPVCPAADVMGAMDKALCERLGLAEPPAIHVGLHDSNAALAPFLDPRPDLDWPGAASPFTFVSSGTWAIVFSVGGAAARLDPARDTLLNVDPLGRPVPSARAMLGREFEIAMQGRSGPPPTIRDLDAVLTAEALLEPGLVPSVGPFPDAHGQTDLPRLLHEDLGARHAAFSFYAALVLREMMSLTSGEGPILLDGALGQDRLVPDLIRILTNRAVYKVATSSSLGCATLIGCRPAFRMDPVQHGLDRLEHKIVGCAERWSRQFGG